MTDQTPVAAHPAIAEDLFCQNCGYNLRGLTGDICPECGGSLAGVRLQLSQIPWVHRKELGWWRAYWKTISFVMFRQRRFAEEMARPVSYRDSQSFRWLTILFAYAPLLVGGFALPFLHESGSGKRNPDELYLSLGLAVLLQLAIALFLAAATGIPSYLFHPRSVPTGQQNRAIALSYYASGPLAISFVPAAAVVLSSALQVENDWWLLFMLVAIYVPLAQLAVWCIDLVHLSRRLLPQHPGRAVFVALATPLLWLMVGVLIFFGIFTTAFLAAFVFFMRP